MVDSISRPKTAKHALENGKKRVFTWISTKMDFRLNLGWKRGFLTFRNIETWGWFSLSFVYNRSHILCSIAQLGPLEIFLTLIISCHLPVRSLTRSIQDNILLAKCWQNGQKSHENAFFAIFKRLYGRFGVRYGIHRLWDDFYWLNLQFLKFWPRSDEKQQKCFFSSACTFSPSGRSGAQFSKKLSPGDIWPRLQWYAIICILNMEFPRKKFGGRIKKTSYTVPGRRKKPTANFQNRF